MSGKNLLMVIAVIFVVFLILACAFYAIGDGLMDILIDWISKLFNELGNKINNFIDSVKRFFGISTVKGSMMIYLIGKDDIAELKSQIESSAIETDNAGLSEIMLRKMLLTHAATSSTNSTLCVAEVTKKQLLQEIGLPDDAKSKLKEKSSIEGLGLGDETKNNLLNDGLISEEEFFELEGEDFDKIYNYCNLDGDIENYITSKEQKDSEEIWPTGDDNLEERDLYFVTDSFFYFYDNGEIEEKIYGSNEAEATSKIYLGVMGKVGIESVVKGDEKDQDGNTKEMQFVTEEEFYNHKEAYEELDNKEDYPQVKEDLLSVYTKGSDGNYKVWVIEKSATDYQYSFLNNNISDDKPLTGSATSVYTLKEATIQMEEMNIEDYAIPLELLVEFLHFTGSPEYLDKFMDYAIEIFEVKISAYSLETEEKTYYKRKYNINADYVFEVYDMENTENMSSYHNIIFERFSDNGTATKFEGTVDADRIDHSGGNAEMLKDIENMYNRIKNSNNSNNGNNGNNSNNSNNSNNGNNFNILGSFGNLITNIFNSTIGIFSGSYNGNTNNNTNNNTNTSNGKDILEEMKQQISKVTDKNLSCEIVDDNNVVKLVITYGKAKYEIDSEGNVSLLDAGDVDPLEDLLELSYDPGTGFNLGEIEVEETKIETKTTTDWDFKIHSISTWYGEVKYKPRKIINKMSSNYNMNAEDIEWVGEETVEHKTIFIDKSLKDAANITDNDTSNGGVIVVDHNDIYDNILYNHNWLVVDDVPKFKEKTLYYLGLIAQNDGGDYNKGLGIFEGSDYIYSIYREENLKTSTTTTWKMQEAVDNGVEYDWENLNKFLGLWKNKDGVIPEIEELIDENNENHANRIFDSDGKKVAYLDIYNAKNSNNSNDSNNSNESRIYVGDMFENAPEMFYEILEKSDNTKKLVDVFKYIMYIYTDENFGVTDLNDANIQNILFLTQRW